MDTSNRTSLDPNLIPFADRLDGQFALWAGTLRPAVDNLLSRLGADQTIERLYARTPSIWSQDPAVQKTIANRLGWLVAPDAMLAHLPRVQAFAAAVRAEGTTDVVLLGMGGSSLAPEVLRTVVGVAPGWPRFHMLDSTDPDAVAAVTATISLPTTLFILASKSGGTIEPNSMAAHFGQALVDAGLTNWASRFVAITDEGTGLHRRATEQGFREIFVNPTDIGGRYSAVSLFGIVPAALMGHDVDAYVSWARAMLWLCGPGRPLETNPAAVLGATMAAGEAAGRDKLTLVLPPALETFGLWVEQLVAESTGKSGRGVVPVAGEALRTAEQYGNDRLLVSLALGTGRPDTEALRALAATDMPWLESALPESAAVGAAFVVWELATALAGALMGVNPFDEPNVAQAKAATQRLLDGRQQGALTLPEGGTPVPGGMAWITTAARQGAAAAGQPISVLTLLAPGDYVAILAYLGPDSSLMEPVAAFRNHIGTSARVATTVGYGPRYLHSTGQLHKGGANNGVFVLVFGGSAVDLPVPGSPFTFAVLEQAQALGDFASLEAAGRRAIAIRLERQTPDTIAGALEALLRSA